MKIGNEHPTIAVWQTGCWPEKPIFSIKNATKWEGERKKCTPPDFDCSVLMRYFFLFILSCRYTIEYMVQIHFLFDRTFFVFCSSAKQCMTNQRVYAMAHDAHTLEHMRTKWESKKKRPSSTSKEARHTLCIYICEYITLCYDERLIFFG